MSIEVIRYRLPVYWACALINGDYSGLSEEEIQEIDAFLRNAEGYAVDVDWETQGFYRCNDAGTLCLSTGTVMEKKITQEEFDDFVKNVDRSKLPEGIKFELK